MNTPTLLLTLVLALPCGIIFAQDKSTIDWDAEYKQLLESDPSARQKIESGKTTKEEVIQWLQETRGKKKTGKKSATKVSKKRDLSAFRKKLDELVESGKLSKADAAKLAATMSQEETAQEEVKKQNMVDWDAEYETLLKSNLAVRRKVENSGATKEQVIEFLRQKAGAADGKLKGRMKARAKPGARKGSVNFYSIVIGKLRSKDIELGELEMDVDYVLGEASWAKQELVGQRVRLVGVAGAFLDNLLRIKRGETIKVRTGDYNRETKVLGFGYKFQVLERTSPFNPEEFGVPPNDFRGFRGELLGKVVEALGYEVLLDVQESKPADDSKAKDAESILGKRIRIAGFYDQHRDQFANLHEGDKIRVSVAHRNSESDALNVTTVLKRVDDGVKAALSAEPMHTPTKMPTAKAESVGMSTDGLRRIDEVMQEHIDAGRIQGAVTIVARRGKVVHFSTHVQPGTQWAYGNAGIHAVVPRIIEIVSETPFEEFVRGRVLNPLEMNNSYFDLPSEKESKRVVVMFKGREVKKKGGTGLSSSAEDYLHFQQMLLNGGELFGHRLLSPASVATMSSNQVGDLFSTSRKGKKGMGFGYTVAVTLDPNETGNNRGKDAFGWGGAGGTMSWTDPENELVAVIMLQQPRGSMQSDFANAIQEAIIE